MRNNKSSSLRFLTMTVMCLPGCFPEDTSPPTDQPTLHRWQHISTHETWRAADNPHIVIGQVTVGGASSPTLTLEAGVVVRFEEDASLKVGFDKGNPGELRVEGTEDLPVLLTANADNPQPDHWRGVHLGTYSSSASRMAYATIEYATGDSYGCGLAGGLTLGDCVSSGENPSFAVVDHLTVQKSMGSSVVMYGDFGPGSSQLISRDNGVALSADPNSVGSIPADSIFSGNQLNAVQLRSGAVRKTQTWPRLSIPYLLDSILKISELDTDPPQPPGPDIQLTLPPGTEIQMDSGASIFVSGPTGRLIAQGTDGAPIRFVPNTATPRKNHWVGLFLIDSPESRLDHVFISHADVSNLLVSPGMTATGEVGPIVTNSTFSDSARCGIQTRTSSSGVVPLDYTLAKYNNTFLDNEAGAQCNGG